MTDETPLDAAHRVMTEAPEDDAARLRFYARLADSELCLMLVREAEGGTLDPEIFEVEGGRFVLAFDREDRLAAFAGRAVAYAAMPGRALAGMLAGQGVGIGLNLDAAPSAMLLPAEAVDWLANTLAEAEGTPAPAEARPVEVRPPEGLPRTLLAALDGALARAGGIAAHAALAAVRYEDGGRGHLLAIVGAAPGAEGALARSVQEALVFSGLEAGALDVTFLAADDPLVARLDRAGLRFDLPEPEPVRAATPAAPGSDPDRPPRLR